MAQAMSPFEADPADLYLPYLPEEEELDRLDALLADMLAKSQRELDRLAPQDRPDAAVLP
jgi:hypothetical protein